MHRNDNIDRCTFCFDRVFGIDIRPLCKQHDFWYKKANNIFVKLFYDFCFSLELCWKGFPYAWAYRSESTMLIGRTLRKIGVLLTMPVIMIVFGCAAFVATITVGTLIWVRVRYFT